MFNNYLTLDQHIGPMNIVVTYWNCIPKINKEVNSGHVKRWVSMIYKSCQVFLLRAKEFCGSGNAACENEQKCRDDFIENSLRRGTMKKLGVSNLKGQI